MKSASLPISVSRETERDLRTYASELVRWNRHINLIAKSTEEEVWSRHIVDCLQLVALAPENLSWLDLGSGGGLPGLVTAFVMRERLGHVTLVESNRKKTAFLGAMIGKFHLPATVKPQRIEEVEAVLGVGIVTARALAPLALLLPMLEPWIAKGATALLQKGRGFRAELDDCRDGWDVDLIEHGSIVDPESVILRICGLRRR